MGNGYFHFFHFSSRLKEKRVPSVSHTRKQKRVQILVDFGVCIFPLLFYIQPSIQFLIASNFVLSNGSHSRLLGLGLHLCVTDSHSHSRPSTTRFKPLLLPLSQFEFEFQQGKQPFHSFLSLFNAISPYV